MTLSNLRRRLLLSTLLFIAFVCEFTLAFAHEDASIDRKQRLNALNFGVVADDESVDNTAALQSALDAAGELGGAVVELPSGRFRINGTLVVPAGTTLAGTYRVPPTVYNKDEKPTGTTLLTYANRGNPNGEPFINLKGSNSAVMGLVISYPEWSATDVPPVPYPACIYSQNTCNVGVIDCCLLNPYEGIRFVLAARHIVRNVTGYPIWRGFFVDQCYDIGHIENIHFWPFGVTYKADDPYCEWINLHGTAFEFARTDWHYVSNTFCFGYGRGYYFSDRGSGGANGNFLGIGADSCRRAILVEQSQKQGLLITNGEFVGRWSSEDSICVEIGEANDGAVMLTNCSFWGPVMTCVQSKQKTGRVTLNACEFVNWDEVHSREYKRGSAAVDIQSGRATLNACSFEQGGTHLFVGADATHVTAVGNQAPGGFRVSGEKSPLKMQSYANELDPLEVFPEGKENYRFRLGEAGDSRFLRYWYGPEMNGETPFRWSGNDSRILLPTSPDASRIVVCIDLDAPIEAVDNDENSVVTDDESTPGVYLGDSLLASFQSGSNALEFEIPISADNRNQDGEIELVFRCKAWRPKDCRKGSSDERQLGVACRSVSVKNAESDREDIFNPTLGIWEQR